MGATAAAAEMASEGTLHHGHKYHGVRGTKVPASKVIVVGSGLAGLCATIEAARLGAVVVMLEKEERCGGNSAKATSGINGVLTAAQEATGVQDSFHQFHADTLKSGGGLSEPQLVDTLSAYAQSAIAWLRGEFNLDLTALSHCGGHSVKRTHRMPPGSGGRPVPVGWTTVSTLQKVIEEMENVTVIKGAQVLRIMTEEIFSEVNICGVEYTLGNRGYYMAGDAVRTGWHDLSTTSRLNSGWKTS